MLKLKVNKGKLSVTALGTTTELIVELAIATDHVLSDLKGATKEQRINDFISVLLSVDEKETH